MKFPLDIAKCNKRFSSKQSLLALTYRSFKPMMLLFFCLFFALCSGQAQSRKDLETKRKKLISDIKVTSNLLQKTEKNRAVTLDRYVALQSQIKSREALLATLAAEMDYLDASIERNTGVVESLEADIAQLEEEYAQMVRKAQRLQMSNSRLLFIFSAEGFNDALRRWQYIRQYDNYRKKQAQLILRTQNTLAAKVQQLESQREEQQTLMASESEQKGILEKEVSTKTTLLKTLRNDEDRLRNNLAVQRKAHHKLNTAIENTIRQEIIAQRKLARSPKALRPNKTPSASANSRAAIVPPRTQSSQPSTSPSNTYTQRSNQLTGAFRHHRGRMSWPVSSGVITSYFGKQAHPSLRKIMITNNGIDIQTNPRAEVRAVYEGEVVGTQFIPGHHNMVILRHGNYYTVYSNLEEVSVQRGAQVGTQQKIGRVAVDGKSGKSEVHFEVWRDKVRLNPTDWVKR